MHQGEKIINNSATPRPTAISTPPITTTATNLPSPTTTSPAITKTATLNLNQNRISEAMDTGGRKVDSDSECLGSNLIHRKFILDIKLLIRAKNRPELPILMIVKLCPSSNTISIVQLLYIGHFINMA